MPNLIDTDRFTKARRIRISEVLLYHEVPVIGDLNCGPYALAAGILDLILRDKLPVLRTSVATFNRFLEAIYKSLPILRQRRYDNGEYGELAEPLKEFIRKIELTPAMTFESFREYVASKTSRAEIAAMVVTLGPAIRTLATEIHADKLVTENVASEQEVTETMQQAVDKVPMRQGLLEELGRDFFKVNVDIYAERAGSLYLASTPSEEIQHAPHVALINRGSGEGDHWNVLIPEDTSADGDAGLNVLPSPFAVETLSDSKSGEELEDYLFGKLSQDQSLQRLFDEKMASESQTLYRLQPNESDAQLFHQAREKAFTTLQQKFGLFRLQPSESQSAAESHALPTPTSGRGPTA